MHVYRNEHFLTGLVNDSLNAARDIFLMDEPKLSFIWPKREKRNNCSKTIFRTLCHSQMLNQLCLVLVLKAIKIDCYRTKISVAPSVVSCFIILFLCSMI